LLGRGKGYTDSNLKKKEWIVWSKGGWPTDIASGVVTLSCVTEGKERFYEKQPATEGGDVFASFT